MLPCEPCLALPVLPALSESLPHGLTHTHPLIPANNVPRSSPGRSSSLRWHAAHMTFPFSHNPSNPVSSTSFYFLFLQPLTQLLRRQFLLFAMAHRPHATPFPSGSISTVSPTPLPPYCPPPPNHPPGSSPGKSSSLRWHTAHMPCTPDNGTSVSSSGTNPCLSIDTAPDLGPSPVSV